MSRIIKKYEGLAIAIIGTLLALFIRYSLRGFVSGDFIKNPSGVLVGTVPYDPLLLGFGDWYTIIRNNGFGAFRYNFYIYTPPYLYCLYIISKILPSIQALSATKLPSIFADLILAWFVYCIIKLNYKNSLVPILAYFAILFSPTVILNSSFWGQTDSLYAAPLVACVYYLLTKRSFPALISFSIAFAFKLQAVFLAPFLIAIAMKRMISWKLFLLIPLIYFIAIFPAWLAGRPLQDLLSIYISQANQLPSISAHAPNLYAWFPPKSFYFFQFLYPAGLALAVAIAFIIIVLVRKSHNKLTESMIIELALASVIMMPYFLPNMHDRYFYPADVFTIIYGFYFPEYFYIPLVMNMVSFFAYQPFLFKVELIPMTILALVLLVLISFIVRQLITDLYVKKDGEITGVRTSTYDIISTANTDLKEGLPREIASTPGNSIGDEV